MTTTASREACRDFRPFKPAESRTPLRFRVAASPVKYMDDNPSVYALYAIALTLINQPPPSRYDA